jgi:Cd2+/Zn2+-exporting ATPase
MPVEELAIGDIVVVKLDARLPTDGFVVKGESISPTNRRPPTGRLPGRRRTSSIPPTACSPALSTAAAPSRSRSPASPPTARSQRPFVGWSARRDAEIADPALHLEIRALVPAGGAGAGGAAALRVSGDRRIDEPFRDSFYRARAVLKRDGIKFDSLSF